MGVREAIAGAALVVGGLMVGGQTVSGAQPDRSVQSDETIESFRREAAALEPLVERPATRRWLRAAAALEPIEPRTIYSRREPRAVLSEAEFEALPEAEREGFSPFEITTESYYATRYGTPLAYARAVEIVGEALELDSFRGVRVLDFGYGQIGQLRMLAACGADAVGVDPDPSLAARYSAPRDQGAFPIVSDHAGRVTLVEGYWPSEPEVIEAVGGGYDAIIARNVLKRGYLHPRGPADPRTQLHLGVDDETFLRALHDALKPGGVVLIYSLGSARENADGSYNPIGDIDLPWDRSAVEAAGLVLEAENIDENEMARRVGRALGWEERMDLDNGLFGVYSILRRARE
ncbi:MAG: methyltransferase domain-containing protein [Phycisphaeraceae bacterium]|nr:methyltransferase domain-containing protein [Phycisphaeraceae bacterium]